MGDFGEDSDDSDAEGGLGNVARMIMRPPGHSGKAKKGHLCFDASFETGNLGRVDLVNEYEYDLYVRPDTCSPHLRFWFNFTVDNVKQDQRVIFNIINFSKSRNLFNSGMTPLVKSTSRQKWQRIPKRHVFYYKSPAHHGHYVLSIAFAFDKDDEIFQFALAPPYSYSRLQMYLRLLEQKASHLQESFKRELLANSIQNRRVDLITVGSLHKTKPHDKRRVVVVMARVHAGATPASFVCQGLIDLLASSHPVAATLRQYVIFKIIPMVNPDGVYLGNYRSNLMGVDLNRCWHATTPWAHPALHAARDMLLAIDKNKDLQLDFVLDIHADSTLKGCFIYGNTYEDVYRYERHIVFPKLLASTADDYTQTNAMFNSDINKTGTARKYLCSLLSDNVNCYSFHISFYGYNVKDTDLTIPYTEESYLRSGRNLVRTFFKYYHVTGAIPVELTAQVLQKKRKPHTRRSRSITRNSARRPETSRQTAVLHFMDLNINYYDSETSVESGTFKNQFSPRRLLRKGNRKPVRGSSLHSPPPETINVLPKPTLSIIDFNVITRGDFEKATKG